MASAPPQECCVGGVIHEGTPAGAIENVDGISTYVATPKSKKTDKAILLATDVMGYKAVNAQLIADNLAQNGFLVLMPDLFDEDPAPPRDSRPADWSLDEWRTRHNPENVVKLLQPWTDKIRARYSIKTLGVVGYCYGAKVVFGLTKLKEGSSTAAYVDAAYFAHPSFTSEEDVKACVVPLSIAAAETDRLFPEEKRHGTEKLLASLKGLDGAPLPWQIALYSGVQHGFATRANLDVRIERIQKEAAFRQAVAWFLEWL